MERKVLIKLLGVLVLCLIVGVSYAQQPIQKKVTEGTGAKQRAPDPPRVDANTRKKLLAFPSRATLINSLMGNQTTRALLETSAKNAKMHVNELSLKGLNGKVVSILSQGKTIDQLNWNAGIKFSFSKNRPIFFDLNDKKDKPLGFVVGYGIQLNSNYLAGEYNDDFFIVNDKDGKVILQAYLPPNPATYMIAVQTAIPNSVEVYVDDSSGTRKLNTLPLSTGDGVVGMANISVSSSVTCSITVKPHYPFFFFSFGGITITRL